MTDQTPEPRRKLTPEDCDRILWQIHTLRQEADAILAQAQRAAKALRAEADGKERFYAVQIEDVLRDKCRPGTKCVELLHGRYQFRTVPATAKIEEPEMFVDWAMDHAPETVVTKLTPDAKAAKALFLMRGREVVDEETGEVRFLCEVPGIVYVPETESATFQVAKKGETDD